MRIGADVAARMAENLTARFFFVVVVVVVVVLPGFTGFLTDVCRVQLSYFFINFFFLEIFL